LEYFRGFDKPYFSLCARVDVAALERRIAALGAGASLALGYHFIALKLANTIEPFRLRLEGGQVMVDDVVHGSTTVLRGDGSFGFAALALHEDFVRFAAAARQTIEAARTGAVPFEPGRTDAAVIYFTTLPWVHFTSFSHARNWGREDSIPRFAFGRIDAEEARRWLPVSIEVHHALMDGVHVGEFVQRFEAALAEPSAWV
jgi:chloramphenicol O-acetyltransferase type A